VRVGVISDVHGNLAALEAVLAALEVDAIWCLGDLVGYGAKPNECCALVSERASVCLAGNHDLAVRGTIDLLEFSGDAGIAARWTRTVLRDEWLAYLNTLETTGEAENVSLYHGSARDPVWEYVLSDEAALATIVLAPHPLALVGHSHVALQVALHESSLEGGLAPAGTRVELADAKRLLNPGSVGQPRDGDPRAAYLVLDLAARTASFGRVEYDVERTQSEIRAAGLPDVLAARLAFGQ
jgi:diadenosine tetraphosphatase ApaH/serine/threonine PP2A family protein phosphatase